MPKRGTRKSRFCALNQAEGGTRISDLCREHGISEANRDVYFVLATRDSMISFASLASDRMVQSS